MSRSLVLIAALVVAAAGLVALRFAGSERNVGARVSADDPEVVTPDDRSTGTADITPAMPLESDAGDRAAVAPEIDEAEAAARVQDADLDGRVLRIGDLLVNDDLGREPRDEWSAG